MTTKMVFRQSAGWGKRIDDGFCSYATNHCCFCGRPFSPKSVKKWLMLTRDEGGEWYIIDPEDQQPEEHPFGKFILPIGAVCLQRHPEFRFAVVGEGRRAEWQARLKSSGSIMYS